jgi:signal transduction histidine kinase
VRDGGESLASRLRGTRSGGDAPSARLFRRIRWKLTLWYTSVLAIGLLIFCIAVYVTVRQVLINPVDDQLDQAIAFPTQRCDILLSTPLAFIPSHYEEDNLYACYDAHGKLVGPPGGAALNYPGFASPSLATEALQHGTSQYDTVNAGSILGTVRREAAPIPNGQGGFVGAVQVGTQVGSQVHNLDVLMHSLIIFGLLAVLLSAIGGLFLANRALLPARLAYARQRDFIADASHELRTPLTILRADAEVLLRDQRNLSEENIALVEDMVAETTHMASLSNSMLDLARLDAGSTHLERDVVDLSDLTADVARRMRVLAEARHVTIRLESAESVLVLGDRMLLEEAALVLADNAVKYNRPAGEVVLRTRAEDGQAVLEVHDTGIGIAPEHLPRLGERFYRVDKARSREQGGAGLGLSIVQTIAARHGGTFYLESEPGKGTTAILAMPRAMSREA